jgi:hypothetical protein
MSTYTPEQIKAVFAASLTEFTKTITGLANDTDDLTHSEIETYLHTASLKVFRQVFQDKLDLLAETEPRLHEVIDHANVPRTVAEKGHDRLLATIFGIVVVGRLAYRVRGAANLHPADAALNLPDERHSHGLRRLATEHAARGSYQQATDTIRAITGVPVGKRQVEELTIRAARDVQAFYDAHRPEPASDTTVLVMTFDAKGVLMRPDALRAATAAAATSRKLETRLSPGEKRCRKRMAEVAGVYDALPQVRTPADLLPKPAGTPSRPAGPRAESKWLTVSIADPAAHVISAGFDETERRDPDHRRPRIALVDGNSHQIDRIQAEAHARGIDVTILIDLIHVIEYVWAAAWCFYPKQDPKQAECWVYAQIAKILQGKAGIVAGAIRRKATYHGLDPGQRAGVDACAAYLLNKKRYLDYPTALASGWPVATGVIEGACRHLVKDRMDLTGARWGLESAEAVLRLRAVIANNDFDAYWSFHLRQEQQRVHNSRYKGGVIPTQ